MIAKNDGQTEKLKSSFRFTAVFYQEAIKKCNVNHLTISLIRVESHYETRRNERGTAYQGKEQYNW